VKTWDNVEERLILNCCPCQDFKKENVINSSLSRELRITKIMCLDREISILLFSIVNNVILKPWKYFQEEMFLHRFVAMGSLFPMVTTVCEKGAQNNFDETCFLSWWKTKVNFFTLFIQDKLKKMYLFFVRN